MKEGAGENEYSYVSSNPTNLTDPLGLQDGPVNYLRNPFSPDHWVLNGLSNTVSDLLNLDAIAQSAWTLGNWCAPLSDRLWAAAHLLFEVVMVAFGGEIMKGIGGAIFRRIPCTELTAKLFGKACFVAGTLVHTKEGLKPIEEIKQGDQVLSYNEQTKKNEYKLVVETYMRWTEQIVKLQIATEAKAIETTPEHRFYVRIHRARDSIGDGDEDQWREAGKLQIGDEVLSASGVWERIAGVEQQTRSEKVYNFAVQDNHNYFVGEQGTLVHNNCAKWAPGVQHYWTGDMASIEHVMYRHGPNSTFIDVGKFKAGTSRGDIMRLANEAVKNGTPFGSNGILHDFGRVIGTDESGNATSYVLIYLNHALQIRTMFPL